MPDHRAAAQLPDRVDVVVIGGGIVGVSTALELARSKVSVLLLEKGELGAEQSSRNWGWCRTQGRDERELALALESLRQWDNVTERTGGGTGFARCGTLTLLRDDDEIERAHAWLRKAASFGVDARIVEGNDLMDLTPGTTRRWPAGLYAPHDGRAEPSTATLVIADVAREAGVRIESTCAVRGIETAAGRASSVVTERGTVRCDAVVVAGGAWTSLLCRQIGVRFPQLKVQENVMRTAPLTGAPKVSVKEKAFAFRLRKDGGYTIAGGGVTIAEIVPDSFRFFKDFVPILKAYGLGITYRVGRNSLREMAQPNRWDPSQVTPFETCRILDPKPVRSALDNVARNLVKSFPMFQNMRIVERWAGMIDVTPDAIPVISDVPGRQGLFIGSGFSGHGFGLGPGAGTLLAALVTGVSPPVDPAPFSFSRLNSKLRPVIGPL